MKKSNQKITAAISLALTGIAGIATAGEMGVDEPVAIEITAPAQSSSFGYIGVTATYGYATNSNDGNEFSAFAPSIEGAYAFVLGNGGAVVADAMVRMDNYDTAMTGNEVSQPQYQANVHYLHPLSDAFTLGGFAGYGMAPFEDTNERYQVGIAGLTAVYRISDVTSVFGQAAYGTSFDPDAMSSSGFYNGYVVRAGVSYSGFSFATITAEAEYAASEEYEDSSEAGEMWTVALSGESEIGAVENLVVTYGVRYASFDALSDPDLADETTASVGVKYMFGGGSAQRFADIGYIGTPYLPLRASFWTPEMD